LSRDAVSFRAEKYAEFKRHIKSRQMVLFV
jgi:hypothetical protein